MSARFVAAWVLSLSIGCSVTVSPEAHPVRCVVDGGTGLCPDGYACMSGVCERERERDCGVVSEEICNGLDDDCNGVVDDGADEDFDGYTWCGGGVQERADCDDGDPGVYPGAMEVCDGVDNDCDGNTDGPGICGAGNICFEGACFSESDCRVTGCGEGQTCDTTQPVAGCVDPRCPSQPCDEGQACDEGSGVCVDLVGYGEPCTSDAACLEGHCEDGAFISPTLVGGRYCVTACCSQSSCDAVAGTMCHDGGTGAKFCVPPALVGLDMGAGRAGDACTHGCRSGICADMACVEWCSSQRDCTSPNLCALTGLRSRRDGPVTAHTLCRRPTGSTRDGSSCSANDDCRSGMCRSGRTAILGLPMLFCSTPCHTRADCDGGRQGCTPLFFPGALSSVAACESVNEPGAGTTGTRCASDADCRDGLCAPDGSGGMVCGDTCCQSQHCAPGFACRAVRQGSVVRLGCLRSN